MGQAYGLPYRSKRIGGLRGMSVRVEDRVEGYKLIHTQLRRMHPHKGVCGECKVETSKLDLANISQQYLNDITDWEYLCRRCHMLKDGRMANLDRRKYDHKTFCKYCDKQCVSRKLGVCMNHYNAIRRNKLEACQ